MAKDPAKAVPKGPKGKAGLSRAEKRAAKKAAKANRPPRGERWKQIVQAYKLTYARDRQLPWWMIMTFALTAALVFLLMTLVGLPLFVSIPMALLFGVLGLMIVFGRRAQKAAFGQVEGQPGAAGWALQNMRGDWRVTQGVQLNSQLDAVHRVLGRPGVVLVGEGQAHRVRPLMAQEKKRVARIAGDAPIYDVLIGDDEGQVPLRKLNNHLVKLPRNLSQQQVNALEKRMAALGGTKSAPLPKGPMPKQARMAGLERTMRRR
jgi:hypothetical protein